MSTTKQNSAIFYSFLIILLITISFSESKKKKNFQTKQQLIASKNLDPSNFHINKEANKIKRMNFSKNSNITDTESIEKIPEIQPFNPLFLQNDQIFVFPGDPAKGEEYKQAVNIECNESNCVYPNYCSNDNKVCVYGLAFAEFDLYQINNSSNITNNSSFISNSTVNNSNLTSSDAQTHKIIYCGYKRKLQTIYFLLEFFSNIGAGHFYAKNYLIASIKFGVVFIPWSFIFVAILTSIAGCNYYDYITGEGTCFIIFFIGFSFFLWILDSFKIGKGFYNDGNGVPLLPW